MGINRVDPLQKKKKQQRLLFPKMTDCRREDGIIFPLKRKSWLYLSVPIKFYNLIKVYVDYGTLIEANDANGVLLVRSEDKSNLKSSKNADLT
ncbi:hypothetical protein TcasGA2_TC003784 [Tribolium castaneum]|uniref:Uncharacterized protein n=1 Tax=Tribolium castaneum TaxID=7070 RepID=D6WEQ2_TRICA|nr:hypothetical protein TcasGA2_TC003784 [Tribolium castaneum]